MLGPGTSIILIILAGAAVIGMALAMIVPAIMGRPVRWKLPVAVAVLGISVGVYGVASLVASVVDAAQRAAKGAPEVAKTAIGEGTAVVLEGFGKTVDHFEEKWKNEAMADLRELLVVAEGVTTTGDGPSRTTTVEILVKNPTARDIDFGRIVKGGFVLAQDNEGVSYLPEELPSGSLDKSLPPNTTTRHRLTFNLERKITLTKLAVRGVAAPQPLPKPSASAPAPSGG
jgi:hypothetical protein